MNEISVNGSVTPPTPPSTAVPVGGYGLLSHVFGIVGVDDVAGSLHETYLILHDQDGSVAIILREAGAGYTAPEHGADRAIEVSYITGMFSFELLEEMASELNSDAAFSASQATPETNELFVTCDEPGERPAGDAGDTGFTVTTEVRGFPRLPLQEIPVT